MDGEGRPHGCASCTHVCTEEHAAGGTGGKASWPQDAEGKGIVTGRDRALHAGLEGARITGLDRFYVPFSILSWRRRWPPTPVSLPGELHGQRSLGGCSPRGHKQSDTTERLTLSLYIEPLKCIDFPGGSDSKASVYNAGDLGSSPGLGRSPGEGNGNPLQYYCLENPMDRGAW